MLFVANNESSEVEQPADTAFDDPTPAIGAKLSAVLSVGPLADTGDTATAFWLSLRTRLLPSQRLCESGNHELPLTWF